MTLENYQTQRRGGKGRKGMQIREEDLIQDMFICSSRDTILLFTQRGRVYSTPAYQIPLTSRTSKGKAIVNFLRLQPEERVIDIINIAEFDDKRSIVFVSALGSIKKTTLDNFSNIRATGIHCMTVREEDLMITAKICDPNDHIIIATKMGYALHFIESELRPMGRTAMGVRGIKLRSAEDRVIDAVVCKDDASLLSITKQGFGKISAVDLYRLTHRGGKGIINIKLRNPTDEVIAIKAVGADHNLLLASTKGQVIRIQASDIRETGRAAKGVILMRLGEDDFITSVAICEADECEMPKAELEEAPEAADIEDEEEEEDPDADEEDVEGNDSGEEKDEQTPPDSEKNDSNE
jgi:DNA gyrase subunit A